MCFGSGSEALFLESTRNDVCLFEISVLAKDERTTALELAKCTNQLLAFLQIISSLNNEHLIANVFCVTHLPRPFYNSIGAIWSACSFKLGEQLLRAKC